ncbi:MAG: hypothetical protein R3F46_01575 [bacterium]
MDTRFGHPDDWGLSPERHSEIANELSDHLDCLQADEGGDAAKAAEAKLATPRVRRKLSAVHIADQVVATLHRRPSPLELRELGWLLFWFVLVLLSTWASGFVNSQILPGSFSLFSLNGDVTPRVMPVALQVAAVCAWLLSGVSRAGFLALLLLSMLRAWRRGPGVCIARLLQYKLLHTVLVLGGMLLIRDVDFWHAYNSWYTAWPLWLNHLSLAGLLLLCGLTIALLPMPEKAVKLGFIMLLLLFLVPSGPYIQFQDTTEHPIAYKVTSGLNERIVEPDDSPLAVERFLEKVPTSLSGALSVDREGNRMVSKESSNRTFGPVWSNFKYEEWKRWSSGDRPVVLRGWTVLESRGFIYSPFTHPGSGFAWLAVPLPLMGVLGFLGMLSVMGRRSALSFGMYLILCMIAVTTTFLPFMYAQPDGEILLLNVEGLVHTPLPGFESLLVGYNLVEDWQLVLGLLLSAGIPWLLTGLFLKAGNDSHQTADDMPDMETT